MATSGIRKVTPWTSEEEATLRRLYPNGGVAACARVLPGRSHHAIVSRIGFLALRLNPGVHARLTRGPTGGGNEAAPESRAGLDDRLLRAAFERIDNAIRRRAPTDEREEAAA